MLNWFHTLIGKKENCEGACEGKSNCDTKGGCGCGEKNDACCMNHEERTNDGQACCKEKH